MPSALLETQPGIVRTSEGSFISLDAINATNCSQAGVHSLKSRPKIGLQKWTEAASEASNGFLHAQRIDGSITARKHLQGKNQHVMKRFFSLVERGINKSQQLGAKTRETQTKEQGTGRGAQEQLCAGALHKSSWPVG